MASIRRHRNKWQAQIRRAGHQPLSRSFIFKGDAEAWSRKIEQQIDSGDLMVDRSLLKDTTVRDLFIRYRDTVTPTKRCATVETYLIGLFCQRRNKNTPFAGAKVHHLDGVKISQSSMRQSSIFQVVPVAHRRDPRCFV